jgi:hypothetical protein
VRQPNINVFPDIYSQGATISGAGEAAQLGCCKGTPMCPCRVGELRKAAESGDCATGIQERKPPCNGVTVRFSPSPRRIYCPVVAAFKMCHWEYVAPLSAAQDFHKKPGCCQVCRLITRFTRSSRWMSVRFRSETPQFVDSEPLYARGFGTGKQGVCSSWLTLEVGGTEANLS